MAKKNKLSPIYKDFNDPEVSNHNKFRTKERICKTPDCTTRLSGWNKGEYCFACNRKRVIAKEDDFVAKKSQYYRR